MRANSPPSSRTLQQRRWWWLLWIALLLPLAQAAATAHGYSHVLKATPQSDEPQAPQADRCALCLAAGALSTSAMPSLAPGLPVSTARHQKPALRMLGIAPARSTLAYRSRAPPSTLR